MKFFALVYTENKHIGSDALSGKMLLAKIFETNKTVPFFGKVRFTKGYICPARLVKGLGEGPAGLEPPAGTKNRK